MSLVLIASISLFTATQPVADEAHVEMLQVLATRLSQETGRLVEADRTLAGLPIYVDRRSMTAAEVLDAVAFSLRASVVKTEKGWRIMRTDADKTQMLKSARDLWRERIRRWLVSTERNAEQAAALGDRNAQFNHYQRAFGDQMERLQKQGVRAAITLTVDPSEFTPMAVLYRDIVRRIGIDKIGQVGPEERRVWSNQPEGNQVPCPEGNALLETFERDQTQFSSRSGSNSSVDAARFTFQQGGSTVFRLTVYDAAGNVVGGYGGPPMGPNMAGPIALSYTHVAQPFAKDASAWKPISSEAKQLLHFMQTAGRPTLTPKDQVPASIRDPDKKDPLDILAGLGLSEMSRKTPGKGLVIAPTDQLLRIAEECIVDGQMNIPGFQHIVGEKSDFEKTLRGGVTVLRAQDPYNAECSTLDRQILATQVRFLLKRPSISMTDVAVAHLRIFPAEASWMTERVLGSLVRSQPRYRSTVLNHNGTVLALIGAAVESSGNRTDVVVNARLDPFPRLINRCVNNGWIRFQTNEKMPASRMDAALILGSGGYEGRLVIGTTIEPALSMLGTVPPTNVAPQDMGYQSMEQIGAMLGNMSSSNAQLIYPGQSDKLPKRDEVLEAIRKSGSYHMAAQEQIHLDLYANAATRARFTIQQTRVEQTNVPFDKLSEANQTRLLEAAMKAVAEIAKGATKAPSTGGNGQASNYPPRA